MDETQADIDTCKIEHLISEETAECAARFLRVLESDSGAAKDFRKALGRHGEPCSGDVESCPCCESECLVAELNVPEGGSQADGE